MPADQSAGSGPKPAPPSPLLAVLGRLAEPDGVANVVVFLTADESSYLTGAEFVIDGGGGASILSV